MTKITNFKDLKVEFPERYDVTEQDGTKVSKTISFSPGTIYQQGTPETAENFNNIQKNSIYEVLGTRVLEGQNEIYDITIDGSLGFEFTDLKLCFTPNETNTKKGSLVRFNNNTYVIKHPSDTVNIGTLFANEKIMLNLNFSKKIAEVTGVLTGGSNKSAKRLDVDRVSNTGILDDLAIEYIQDVGTKKAGYCYKDRNQYGVFKCFKDYTGTSNLAENFYKFDNNELLGEIQNLSRYEKQEIFEGAFTITKTGNIVTITCDTGIILGGLGNGARIFVLNEMFRPKNVIYWNVSSVLATVNPTAPLWIYPNGDIRVVGIPTELQPVAYYGTISYNV